MKAVTNFVITLAAVTMFAACGNTQKPADKDPHAGHNHAAGEGHDHAEQTVTKVSLKDDKLNALYQHYNHLIAALVKGDMADAKVAAAAIELGAKEVTDGSTLAALAGKIATAADIEVQRTVLSDLSNDLIAKVKKSGVNSGEVYVEYCPMALNDKGASWLSNQKDIKNPYFGDAMLTCGEVKETIK